MIKRYMGGLMVLVLGLALMAYHIIDFYTLYRKYGVQEGLVIVHSLPILVALMMLLRCKRSAVLPEPGDLPQAAPGAAGVRRCAGGGSLAMAGSYEGAGAAGHGPGGDPGVHRRLAGCFVLWYRLFAVRRLPVEHKNGPSRGKRSAIAAARIGATIGRPAFCNAKCGAVGTCL